MAARLSTSPRAAVRPARRLTLLRGGGADGWEQIGARPVSIDEERVFAGRAFPMTLSPLQSGRTTLTEWAAEHRETLLRLVRENGAVLLRGFGGMETPQGFSDFVMGLRLEEFGMGTPIPEFIEVVVPAGGWVDDHERLHFPRTLVEECIGMAAKEFTWHGFCSVRSLSLIHI